MSDPAFGANVTRLFDPSKNTHFAISEDAQLELRDLFGALAALGHIMETPPDQDAPEIDPGTVAPIFATFARHGARVMAEMQTQFPGKRKSA